MEEEDEVFVEKEQKILVEEEQEILVEKEHEILGERNRIFGMNHDWLEIFAYDSLRERRRQCPIVEQRENSIKKATLSIVIQQSLPYQ